jgi:hypothetical protein
LGFWLSSEAIFRIHKVPFYDAITPEAIAFSNFWFHPGCRKPVILGALWAKL